MVDSKAGGVAVGGAQGTANAGASEFSGANFTYIKLDSANYNWTTDAGNPDSALSGLCEWVSQKATIVAVNGATSGLVHMICEGPFGWGDSTAMAASAVADLGATGLKDSTGTAVAMNAATTAVSTALVLA